MHDAEIARHLREKGLSYKRISYKLNCDTKTVYRWLNPEYKQREYARKREKRRRKALSGYNALAERLALVGACSVDDRHEDEQKTIAEASAAIRSLSASLAAVTAERDEALEARAHDMARQSSVIAFLRKRRGRLVIERDEAIRERDEIEAAILALISSPPKEKTNDEA
jgi:hypothetical protein